MHDEALTNTTLTIVPLVSRLAVKQGSPSTLMESKLPSRFAPSKRQKLSPSATGFCKETSRVPVKLTDWELSRQLEEPIEGTTVNPLTVILTQGRTLEQGVLVSEITLLPAKTIVAWKLGERTGEPTTLTGEVGETVPDEFIAKLLEENSVGSPAVPDICLGAVTLSQVPGDLRML